MSGSRQDARTKRRRRKRQHEWECRHARLPDEGERYEGRAPIIIRDLVTGELRSYEVAMEEIRAYDVAFEEGAPEPFPAVIRDSRIPSASDDAAETPR
jgi:hypothetical protein